MTPSGTNLYFRCCLRNAGPELLRIESSTVKMLIACLSSSVAPSGYFRNIYLLFYTFSFMFIIHSYIECFSKELHWGVHCSIQNRTLISRPQKENQKAATTHHVISDARTNVCTQRC